MRNCNGFINSAAQWATTAACSPIEGSPRRVGVRSAVHVGGCPLGGRHPAACMRVRAAVGSGGLRPGFRAALLNEPDQAYPVHEGDILPLTLQDGEDGTVCLASPRRWTSSP